MNRRELVREHFPLGPAEQRFQKWSGETLFRRVIRKGEETGQDGALRVLERRLRLQGENPDRPLYMDNILRRQKGHNGGSGDNGSTPRK